MMWGVSLEFREARLLCGINFVFMLFSHVRNSHRWSVLAVRCSLTVWIASFGKLSISVNQHFWIWRFILHIQCITLESRGWRREWLLTYFWAVLHLHMRIKPQRSNLVGVPTHICFLEVYFIICGFWVIIYCIYLNKCRLRISAPFEMWKI